MVLYIDFGNPRFRSRLLYALVFPDLAEATQFIIGNGSLAGIRSAIRTSHTKTLEQGNKKIVPSMLMCVDYDEEGKYF
jgi:hypothetical protein